MKENIYNSPMAKLNYAEGSNHGVPMLLLHGNMGRWQVFSSLLPDLISTSRIYAVDLRGHGKSSRVPGAYALEDHLQDILSFMKEKVQSPVILFGVSLGGMIGLMIAARYPELIRGLIIADSPLSKETLFPIVESQRELGDRIIHLLKTHQIEKLYAEINDDFSSESFCACDPEILESTFYKYEDMVKGYDMQTIFSSIQCQTLILRGEEELGSMIKDTDIALVAKLAPHVEHLKIPGVGHSLFGEKNQVMTAVKNFLNKI